MVPPAVPLANVSALRRTTAPAEGPAMIARACPVWKMSDFVAGGVPPGWRLTVVAPVSAGAT